MLSSGDCDSWFLLKLSNIIIRTIMCSTGAVEYNFNVEFNT